jgi:septal ring factor EnvC (AmiA/AmiB activator)
MRSLALIVVAVLLIHSHSGYAEPAVATPNQDIDGIYTRLKQANEAIEQSKRKRDELIAQLQKIEKQYGAAAGSLHDLGVEINGKQQRLKHLSKDMQKRYAELKLQNDELSKQVKAAFVMGKKEQLRLLLNQQDPALANRMLVYYNYLNKSRLKSLATLKYNIALLEKLEQEKADETESLAQTLRSHQTVQLGLTETKKQRDNLLLTLKQEFKEKTRQLGQLEDNVSESQALIDKLQREALARVPDDSKQKSTLSESEGIPTQTTKTATNFDAISGKPFSELKGQLSWPVKGAIIKKFGSPRSETRWDGVLISAKEGTGIGAISSGRVVFADWLRGYGLLIIIDHGHGYMTLYAFNQSLYKKVGDLVKAGTVIAAVGKSGGREESGLYFGIRHKGKAVDPVLWCRKG